MVLFLRPVKSSWVQKDQLMDKPTVLPFNSLNSAEYQLPNGKLIKDGVTGYSIQATEKKFKVFNEKGDRIGIHNTLEDARQQAVNEYNKSIVKLKSKK